MEYKVTKLQETAAPVPAAPPAGAKRSKHKTFPRSNLKTAKILPVRDPARSPSSKKFTMRFHGKNRRVERIRKTVRRMPDALVRKKAMEGNLIRSSTAPIKTVREMVEGGMIAGFIS
jgi:hypothetical protein